MRDQINTLKHDRVKLVEEMRALTVKAESDGRDLTSEEAQEFDRLETEADSLEHRVGRMEKLAGLEPQPRQTRDEPVEVPGGSGTEPEVPASLNEYRAARRDQLVQDTAEYRSAFFHLMTATDPRDLAPEELRVLSKATAGAGANLVPTSFAKELIQSLRDFGVMRQIARTVSTDSGEAIQVPTVSAHGSAAWTAENAAYTASDETFGQATLNAYKAATLIKVSEELLADSAFDLEAYIRTEFGLRIGVLENTGYVVGDGSGKPTGVTTQASAGVTAASATAITADELIDLFHSLLPPHRRNAVFVAKDSTIKLVRKLKDTTNQYLWQPGLQAGKPDTLLGAPIYADPDMPAATTGQVSVLFGDFSFYWIRDVAGVAIQRLNELYAENGQVGFRAYHRTDGRLLNAVAVKKLTQA